MTFNTTEKQFLIARAVGTHKVQISGHSWVLTDCNGRTGTFRFPRDGPTTKSYHPEFVHPDQYYSDPEAAARAEAILNSFERYQQVKLVLSRLSLTWHSLNQVETVILFAKATCEDRMEALAKVRYLYSPLEL